MPFQAGNKLAKGGARPNSGPKPHALKDELRRLMDTAAPLKERKAIIQKAVERAREGSAKHAEFVFAYAYGKPAQVLQVEGPGGGPLLIEYVNDWREDPASVPPSGAADDPAPGEAA